jgi:hypothetical protein
MVVVDTNDRNDEIDETNNSSSQVYYRPPAGPVSGMVTYISDEVEASAVGEDNEVYVLNLSAEPVNKARLTDNAAEESRPILSPGYDKVLFTSDLSGATGLYTWMSVPGCRSAVCLTPDDPTTTGLR